MYCHLGTFNGKCIQCFHDYNHIAVVVIIVIIYLALKYVNKI